MTWKFGDVIEFRPPGATSQAVAMVVVPNGCNPVLLILRDDSARELEGTVAPTRIRPIDWVNLPPLQPYQVELAANLWRKLKLDLGAT